MVGVMTSNHILRALFPVLTTDLLTPFIDLLEDVMLQQVPPLVVSCLWCQPLSAPKLLCVTPVVHSRHRAQSRRRTHQHRIYPTNVGSRGKNGLIRLRVENAHALAVQWFEHLSHAPSAPAHTTDNILSALGLQKKTQHSRTSSSISGQLGHARRDSGDSQRHHDRSQRIYEADERKKRDRILRTIGGRRGQGMGAFAARSGETGQTALKPEGSDGQMNAGDVLPEGTTVRGDENDAEEGDEGQYVNLAVDFSYDGRKNRKGWDLHFLIYMGMGVKGLGGFEVPIWVTMLKITGTVSLVQIPWRVELTAITTGAHKIVTQS